MESKKSKTLMLNTLLLIFCVVVIALFCFGPNVDNKVQVLEKYSITFDSDGGSAIAALTIEEGKKVNQPEAPTKEGYIFVGWMLDDKLYDFSTNVTGNVTLKAKWEIKAPDVKYFTINFSTSGGSLVTPITVAEGNTGQAPIAPTREGFNFVGWQLNGLTYDFTQPVTGDITLVAVWEVVQTEPEEPEQPEEPEEDVVKYKVKFNLNGGTGGNAKTQTIAEGKKASKPSKNPTRSGFTFMGWYLDGKAYNFGTAVTKDITLVAQWQEVKAKIFYVDVYDANGSRCTSLSVEEGKTVNIPSNCANQSKAGNNFVGWNTSKNASSANFTPGKTAVTKTISIYPAFRKKSYAVACSKSGNTGSPTCLLSASIDGKAYTGKIVLTWNGNTKEFDSGGRVPVGPYTGDIVAEIKDGTYTAKVTFKVS